MKKGIDMEHIVQFAVGIDDEAIKKRVEESAEKQIVDKFYKDFTLSLRKDYWASHSVDSGLSAKCNALAKEAVDNIIGKYKNEVIEEAAKILADRLLRTKAAKEMLENVVESDASAE